MERTGTNHHSYGLIGRNISYSFSRSYFNAKFKTLGLDHCSYENFDLESIDEFPDVLSKKPDLKGLNVTIPYKESVIPYLDELEPRAVEIGAVNTIAFTSKGLVGHNTDAFGFRQALISLLRKTDRHALILGTGGASKAVAYVLNELGINFRFVSRQPVESQFHYSDLTREIIETYTLIVNCTPLGTYPDIEQKPPIPYDFVGQEHFLFDLIYNPAKSAFLKSGESKGARILNGLSMLEFQAEKAWEIWNS